MRYLETKEYLYKTNEAENFNPASFVSEPFPASVMFVAADADASFGEIISQRWIVVTILLSYQIIHCVTFRTLVIDMHLASYCPASCHSLRLFEVNKIYDCLLFFEELRFSIINNSGFIYFLS